MAFLARQLKVSPEVYQAYAWRGRVIKRHRATIRAYLGFREGTVADGEAVSTWQQAHVLPETQQLEALVEAVYQRYRALKIEPPTSGRIARLARSALCQYSEQFCEGIAAALPSQTKTQLDALLMRDDAAEQPASRSPFGHLKTDAGVARNGCRGRQLERNSGRD